MHLEIHDMDDVMEALKARTGLTEASITAGALLLLDWCANKKMEGYDFAATKTGTEHIPAIIVTLNGVKKGT